MTLSRRLYVDVSVALIELCGTVVSPGLMPRRCCAVTVYVGLETSSNVGKSEQALPRNAAPQPRTESNRKAVCVCVRNSCP